MTFKKFKEIVTLHKPEITVYQHGDNNSVSVQFTPDGKIYDYSGSYIYVLNRIGIKAVHQSDLNMLEKELARLETDNGKPNIWFGGIADYSEQIDWHKTEIDRIKKECIIVE